MALIPWKMKMTMAASSRMQNDGGRAMASIIDDGCHVSDADVDGGSPRLRPEWRTRRRDPIVLRERCGWSARCLRPRRPAMRLVHAWNALRPRASLRHCVDERLPSDLAQPLAPRAPRPCRPKRITRSGARPRSSSTPDAARSKLSGSTNDVPTRTPLRIDVSTPGTISGATTTAPPAAASPIA
jgi:hypothetical protein